ncbi:DUF3489 domain-containing protein [Sphingorhabdus contaminans]|uniref:DUF3489 domain-containing protein n=1 Tax=Sphingorhabdus contaminans TaxID=1343899 RepID=UPI003D2743C5
MTTTSAAKLPTQTSTPEPKTKNQQIIDLLSSEEGATLDDMSKLANWQPHSTRSFMTGLKKKGHVIESVKIDGVRRYRILPSGDA